ncbi:MAG TPA: hypothetical protein VGI83_02010 [Gemmatimonadales bacterium]
MSLSRREFTKSVAAAAALPLVPAASAESEATPDASPPAPQQQQQQPVPSSEGWALAEYIRVKYGTRLSMTDFNAVVQRIDGGLRQAARLNDPKLANGDEPFFIYRAWRSEG